MKPPVVIKIYGKARRANVDGEMIERQDEIYVPSEHGWFRTIDTYSHFVYYNNRRMGSTLMCSCGSVAGIFQYDAYGRFQSTNMGRIVACVTHMNSGRHADGSTE